MIGLAQEVISMYHILLTVLSAGTSIDPAGLKTWMKFINFEGNSRTSPFRVELFMLRSQKLGNEIQCISEKTKKMEKKKKKKTEEEEKHKKNELSRKTCWNILRRR